MTKLLSIILLCLFLASCASQIAPFEEHVQYWKGRNISELIELKKLPHADDSKYVGKKRVIELNSGNKVYEFPYPKCPVFFEVDSTGNIVNITTEDNKDCY